jgi:hypothetical protein
VTVWYAIKTLDGRTLSRTHSLADRWSWIADNVMADTGCDLEEINIEETDEADYITIRGKRFAICERAP